MLAEIVNLVFRSCGCNESLDADQVVDYDGVLDVLDEFTEGAYPISSSLLMPYVPQEQTPTTYPLISLFKKFRKSLCEFL